ncbi:MAG: LLM class flavin-dependent oxidoreductase [Actinomycetota bacterium]
MKFGLALPHYDFSFPDYEPVTFERTVDVAVRAEQLGFDSVWISDHFFLSLARYGGGDTRHGSLEALTTLAGIAARTERIRVGTLVLAAPLRHAGLLAKSAATIDLLSNGRLDLGIGAAWYGEEFEAFGYDFETVSERFARLEESVEMLRLLFADSPASFDGRFYKLRDALNRPLPAQRPGPPIWIGAKGGPRALRLAARSADGWNTVWRWTPEAYADRSRAADKICEEEDRDPATLRRSLGLNCLVGEDQEELERRYESLQRWIPGGALDSVALGGYSRDTLSGTPASILERLALFSEIGVEEMIINPGPVPFSLFDASMLETFAKTVIPKGRAI